MDLGLQGKRVVITGSTTGIGLIIAKIFLEEGALVVINGSNPARLEEALRILKTNEQHVIGVCADISTAEGVDLLFTFAVDMLGGVDILINNAGIYRHSTRLMDLSDDSWDEIIRVNLQSVHRCSRRAFTTMKNAGGVILNASSFSAIIPSIGAGAYAASKAAIINMTRTMAAELAPWNIRVNAYIPGVITTGMTSEVLSSRKEELMSQISIRRPGRPDEVAAPIVFLSSSKASYITGAVLEISGGKLSVQHPNAAWDHL